MSRHALATAFAPFHYVDADGLALALRSPAMQKKELFMPIQLYMGTMVAYY
jgi:hypothetical protein